LQIRSAEVVSPGLSAQIPEEKLTGIKEALFQGQKIQAIKIYRKSTDAGLAEAKEAVEKLEADLRTRFPERFPAKPAGKGRLLVVLLLAISLLVLLWVVWR
jgi:hypothetical protein